MANILLNQVVNHLKGKVESSYTEYNNRLSTVNFRNGEMPSMLETLMVDYYGMPTPMMQVASSVTRDSYSISLVPFETNLLKGMEKAIRASNLGLAIDVEKNEIRIILPKMTDSIKQNKRSRIQMFHLDVKNRIEQTHRETNSQINYLGRVDHLPETEIKSAINDAQNVVDDYYKKCEAIAKTRLNELANL